MARSSASERKRSSISAPTCSRCRSSRPCRTRSTSSVRTASRMPSSSASACTRTRGRRVPIADRGGPVGVYTNTGPTGPYRGSGRPVGVYLIERVMDEAARLTGLDPVEIRRRNFIPSDAFPYRTAFGTPYDSGNYARALDRALELADYEALRRQQAEKRQRGDIMGIGVATYVESTNVLGWESGVVRVERTGKVTAITGSSPHG